MKISGFLGLTLMTASCSLPALALAQEANATLLTPINSSLDLEVSSTSGSVTRTDADFKSQGSTTNLLNASASATANSSVGTVTTQIKANAVFTDDADAGTVKFNDVGWITETSTGSAITALGTDWTYTFVSNIDGNFILDYSIFPQTGNTSDFGLQGFSFNWSGVGGGQSITNAFDPTSSGTIARIIESGVSYTFGLENHANISGGLLSRTSLMDATFDWRAEKSQQVPEPTSVLGLIIAASLGIGTAIKRQSN